MRKTAELLLALLRARHWSMGTAESCTGGLIASLMVELPGVSEVFKGAVVSYANEVKAGVLGVPEEVISDHGAVSAECVHSMLAGAVRALKVECAVAASGVAGPDGGTPEKPVGCVYIGAKTPERELVSRFQFGGDRGEIREKAAKKALEMLIHILQ